MYIIIWEYEPAENLKDKFEKIYGPKGVWVKLFQKDKNYLGTDLLIKNGSTKNYITIDRWVNEIAYLKFKEEYAEKYKRIDKECEAFTINEKLIGIFKSL